jgi:hypothetical protein
VREGLLMFAAGEKESRIGSNVKRPFFEAVKLAVHSLSLLSLIITEISPM